jgi:hypothetical protein
VYAKDQHVHAPILCDRVKLNHERTVLLSGSLDRLLRLVGNRKNAHPSFPLVLGVEGHDDLAPPSE